MRISILGGAFDPPHKGHLAIAQYMLDQHLVDQVILMPAHQHPFKKQLSPNEERLQLVKLAIASLGVAYQQQIKVSRWELDQSEPSYSINTIKHFMSSQPEATWSWIIGSDNIASFPRWHQWQAFLTAFKVWVYPRQGSEQEALLPGMEPIPGAPLRTISSTQVREILAEVSGRWHEMSDLEQQQITALVPAEVAAYSIDHGIYKPTAVAVTA